MNQSTLFRDWHPPSIVVPTWVFRGHADSHDRFTWGIYWYCDQYPDALEGLNWWFDADGVCDDWRLI